MEFLYTLPLMVKAIILGIVEGLTEFLPISSTGHLILAGSLLGWNDDKAQVFDIAIQTGAILAVIWYYRVRIGKVLAGLFTDRVQQRFALNVIIGFLPAAVFGVLFSKAIKAHLFGPVPVAIALVVGGFIIFWVEKRQESIKPRVTDIDSLTALDALKLGLAQCCALIPGTSRSGSTIIGGMLLGWIAGGMLITDPAVADHVSAWQPQIKYIAEVGGALLVLLIGTLSARRQQSKGA